MYVLNDDYFVVVELKRTKRKIGTPRELFKKIPRLRTFRTQSVNKGLIELLKCRSANRQSMSVG